MLSLGLGLMVALPSCQLAGHTCRHGGVWEPLGASGSLCRRRPCLQGERPAGSPTQPGVGTTAQGYRATRVVRQDEALARFGPLAVAARCPGRHHSLVPARAKATTVLAFQAEAAGWQGAGWWRLQAGTAQSAG